MFTRSFVLTIIKHAEVRNTDMYVIIHTVTYC